MGTYTGPEIIDAPEFRVLDVVRMSSGAIAVVTQICQSGYSVDFLGPSCGDYNAWHKARDMTYLDNLAYFLAGAIGSDNMRGDTKRFSLPPYARPKTRVPEKQDDTEEPRVGPQEESLLAASMGETRAAIARSFMEDLDQG